MSAVLAVDDHKFGQLDCKCDIAFIQMVNRVLQELHIL